MTRAWRVLLGAVMLTACGSSAEKASDSNRATTPPTAATVPATTPPPTATTVPVTTSPPTTSPATTSQAPSTTEAVHALPALQSIVDGVPGVVAIASQPFPDWVTLAGNAAWVANAETGIARYDRVTGELIGSTPAGSICLAMDTAADSLWVGDCEATTLLRVNLASGDIEATIALPFTSITEESSIAAGPDGVFILGDQGKTIAHIDPADNTIVGTFDAPAAASALRAGDGVLWVTSDSAKLLSRVDPVTGSVLAEIGVGLGARFLAVGEGSVWVMNNRHGTVSRVDPVTNTVVATIKVSDTGIHGGDMAVGGGYAWARVSDALVAQIDPATDLVVARFGPPHGSGSVAADDDAVWISAHDVTTVWRIPTG